MGLAVSLQTDRAATGQRLLPPPFAPLGTRMGRDTQTAIVLCMATFLEGINLKLSNVFFTGM